ncbi:DEAD/DEAH box helicase [Sneathiella sp.]|uniref:DEAD/DEAH box helicase n=1 Tax=Sneathiella sp. TaxID=1964365 RepID=UPI003564538E
MDVKIHNDTVQVYAAGVGLLRLKAEIAKRISGQVNSGKGYISFPLTSLHMVSDLLPDTNSISPEVIYHLDKYKLHDSARKKALNIMDGSDEYTLPEPWKSYLDPAQMPASAAMTVPNLLGLCLFDEQGSGKTVMTIAAFDILIESGDIDGMIVVCPKSMISEWPKDIANFLPDKFNVVIAEGTRKEKYDTSFEKFDVLVSNYEGVEAMLVSLMASASNRRFLLVVDESYYLKNSESLRSEHTTSLRSKCKRCFVLCGTPAPNTAHDLLNQFDLADLGFTFGGFKKSKDPQSDWDKIASLTNTRGLFIRRLKSEILSHVPEKNFHVMEINLMGKQKLIYETARSELELELKNLNNETFKKKLATYFQKRAALLQICSCPSAVDPTFSEVPAKYQALDELLETLISQNRKVIIWSFYKRSIDEIEDRYKKYNPVRVDGSVSTDLRREAVRSFQEDSKTMLFIGNPAAAGAGITLHSSFDAVYISYSNQAAHYLQSLDRIHRRGQVSNEVNYYLLICKGTIEETEVIKLRGKEIRQHDLLGDRIQWPSSLDEALKELKSNE